jgi:hypothetical protein
MRGREKVANWNPREEIFLRRIWPMMSNATTGRKEGAI